MLKEEAEELFKKKPLGYEMKPELEIYTDGFQDGYNKANEWHCVKDKLPPDPKESEDGKSIIPLNYICAYALNNEYDDFEIGDFLYMGDGDWLGENENYPIYAWLDKPMEIPKPTKGD